MATQGNEDASGPNKRYRRNSQNSAETHNTAFSNATSGGNVGWAALNSSRDIADLFPAERLIVWAFRHLSQGVAGTNIVEKQLSCLMLEPEADAFLTAGLAINAQFQLPPAGDAPQRSISIAEERLLAFFFAAQVGSSLHTVLGEPLFKSNSLLIVWRDAKDICDLLSAATLAFSSPPDLEPPCWRMGKLLPAVNLAPRLSSGERLILRALRCCSAQKDSGESLDSKIHDIFN